MRDLLKSKKAETRKLSELPKTEQNRLTKLNLMPDELIRGKNVKNRRLATWLTEEGKKAVKAHKKEAVATVKKLILEFNLTKGDIRGKAMKQLEA